MPNPLTVERAFGHKAERRTFKEHDAFIDPQMLIGIEIEAESAPREFRGWLDDDAYWCEDVDDSLRNNGIEIKLRQPLAGYDLWRAIRRITGKKPPGTHRLKFPMYRTSTHIHLDGRDMTVQQVLTLVLIYMTFERILFNFTGKDKENHIFCLPFYKADGDVNIIANLVKDIGVVKRVHKYTSLFLGPLNKGGYGSMEFRQFPAGLDREKLFTWVNLVMCLKRAAMRYNDKPWEFPVHVSRTGPEAYLNEVFGQYADALKYPEFLVDLFQGIRFAQDVANHNRGLVNNQLMEAARAAKQGRETSPFTRFVNKHNLSLDR